MKRVAIIFLCLGVALSMAACQNNDTPVATTEGKDYSEFAGIVADPVTWLEEFEKLPIANENMTTDQLRQLCVDAFKANLSFQWTPNKPIQYTYELSGKYRDVSLPTGIAYSGLMYGTSLTDVGGTVGTIWKVLPYYDKETGVVDIEAMGDKYLACLTSACSYGALQGWNRVSNSHDISGMESYNRFDSNIVLVGPYTYESYDYNYNFGSRTATTEIIAANGEQVMYESYAAMLPADGLFTSPGWHVIMCSIAPVVVKNDDGTINGDESFLHVCEQETTGTRSDKNNYKQSNGVDLRPLGMVDKKYTFKDLLTKCYIPFTLKEFTGEDPVEAGKAWIGEAANPLPNGQDMTIKELFTRVLYTNYTLCNVEVTVKNPDGKELLTYDPSVKTNPRTYSVNLQEAMDAERLAPYANGKNTVHIYARLATGELLEAYNTVLKVD